MHFTDDETGQILQQMHEQGVDLTQLHSVDFFLLFEQQAHAQGFIDALAHAEVAPQASLSTCPDTGVFEVKASLTMVPEYELINNMEAYLESLADKHNGYGDGWGLLDENNAEQ
ncbi:ribonuclease E inhibitor RraB [Pseudoalteromonas sp. YIC-827]|uniref:Ribonuclease E inhibitor RraB n=1 Tax=Pseudoalteromonas qingdaonensis TaxID=3131913 RepID=A0ABU9MUC5_9GAMM